MTRALYDEGEDAVRADPQWQRRGRCAPATLMPWLSQLWMISSAIGPIAIASEMPNRKSMECVHRSTQKNAPVLAGAFRDSDLGAERQEFGFIPRVFITSAPFCLAAWALPTASSMLSLAKAPSALLPGLRHVSGGGSRCFETRGVHPRRKLLGSHQQRLDARIYRFDHFRHIGTQRIPAVRQLGQRGRLAPLSWWKSFLAAPQPESSTPATPQSRLYSPGG